MTPTAPSDEVLRRYLEGKTPPAEAARVEAWLGEDPDAPNVLDRLRTGPIDRVVAAVRDAGRVTPAPEPQRHGAPQQVGNYRLVAPLGEGGMGTVWMAEQRSPVRRDVAIKLIRPGMDSHQVLARFEIERQTLAVLDHPNIARVLDGGVTERGHPYFVMELIKGVPLTEYYSPRPEAVEHPRRA
jgi:serine/threonine protein kinase